MSSEHRVDEPGPQGKATIRGLLDEYGLRPNQSYGQNFLIDPNVIRRIVRLAGISSGSNVVEIGGGTGTLTGALAATGAQVVVYEIDAGLVRVLVDSFGALPNVEIRHEDAGGVDLQDDLAEGPWSLVANLPYNVGTGIVLDALQQAPRVTRIVVMVQREVADRLLADAGTKTYGLPSVITGLHAVGRVAFSVPRQVFEPVPRVDSAVVVLDRVEAPLLSARAVEIAAAGFGQRRKMLRRSLSGLFRDPERVLNQAGIDPTTRPEQLAPADFVRIAEAEELAS